jgi:hypothetical protein
MEALSRVATPGRLLLAGAVLCAAQGAIASEKRTLAIGAMVIAASKCQVDAASGSRCSGTAAAPQVTSASASPASQTAFQGQLVMKMSAIAASFDSRSTLAPTLERVVLTIAP